MLQTYSPIEQGLLAGKASDNYVPKPGEVRDGKTWWRPENIRRVNGMLAGWKGLTEKYQCTLANLCINGIPCFRQISMCFAAQERFLRLRYIASSLDIALSKEDFERMKQDADAVRKQQ